MKTTIYTLMILLSTFFVFSCNSDDDSKEEIKPEINVEILSFNYTWFQNEEIPLWYHYRMEATVKNNSSIPVHGYVTGHRADGEDVFFGEYYNPLYNPLIIQPNEVKTIIDTSSVFTTYSDIVGTSFLVRDDL